MGRKVLGVTYQWSDKYVYRFSKDIRNSKEEIWMHTDNEREKPTYMKYTFEYFSMVCTKEGPKAKIKASRQIAVSGRTVEVALYETSRGSQVASDMFCIWNVRNPTRPPS